MAQQWFHGERKKRCYRKIMIAKPWFGCFVSLFIYMSILIQVGYLIVEMTSKGGFLCCSTKRAVMVVFFGGGGWFPNTPTKEPVCEAESTWIHLRRAEQACWQGNTLGEGQPSTLWLCWRQWHYSNTCRVHASSFLNLLSLSVAGHSKNPTWNRNSN